MSIREDQGMKWTATGRERMTEGARTHAGGNA
jgi:hypothetical protein